MKIVRRLMKREAAQALQRFVQSLGFDLVVHSSKPASALRYPYGNDSDFFEDIRARGFHPRVVVDVGANHGAWSETVVRFFPNVSSLMVEPQAELRQVLQSLASRHNHWQVATCGLGATEGIRKFIAEKDTVSSTFLFDERSIIPGQDVREIQIRTLDSICAELLPDTQPDIVKIDAEGLELEIIEGGQETIRHASLLVVEVGLFEFQEGRPRFIDIVNRMNALGFSLYDLTMFLRRPSDGAMGLMDCVFAADSSILRRSNAW